MAQLMHAAQMARLSGFTYRPVEDLTEWLSKEGLQLVARGQTHFTRSDSRTICTAPLPLPLVQSPQVLRILGKGVELLQHSGPCGGIAALQQQRREIGICISMFAGLHAA